MAKTQVMKVTAPDGIVFTRKTTRIYTHAVFYRNCVDYALAELEAGKDLAGSRWKITRKNYAYAVACAAGTHEHCSFLTESEIAEKQAFIAEYPTLESYLQAELVKRQQHVEDQIENGYFNRYYIAGWCGRFHLAQELAAHNAKLPYQTDVHVVPVNES